MTDQEPFMQLDDSIVQYMTNMLATYNYPLDYIDMSSWVEKPLQQIKVYKPRSYVKASDRERQKARIYYMLNREEILKKRRLHSKRLKESKEAAIKEHFIGYFSKKIKVIRT